MERTGMRNGLNLINVIMTNAEFQRFSELVRHQCGIKMPEAKKSMLEARLRKRLRCLGMDSYGQYWDYVKSPLGKAQEMTSLIDAVTTNKTDFFREPAHFQYLYENAVPQLVSQCGAGLSRDLKIWSAGCATGKEPYTLAMVLMEFALQEQGFRFSILGTDISSRALETARRGIYPDEKAEQIPLNLRRKYLLKSKDPTLALVRISPSVRSKVLFERLNFLDDRYNVKTVFDVIFCRNVLIYFERAEQFKILSRLLYHITPGGYLFTGHSETLHSMNLPLATVAPSVYRLREKGRG